MGLGLGLVDIDSNFHKVLWSPVIMMNGCDSVQKNHVCRNLSDVPMQCLNRVHFVGHLRAFLLAVMGNNNRNWESVTYNKLMCDKLSPWIEQREKT